VQAGQNTGCNQSRSMEVCRFKLHGNSCQIGFCQRRCRHSCSSASLERCRTRRPATLMAHLRSRLPRAQQRERAHAPARRGHERVVLGHDLGEAEVRNLDARVVVSVSQQHVLCSREGVPRQRRGRQQGCIARAAYRMGRAATCPAISVSAALIQPPGQARNSVATCSLSAAGPVALRRQAQVRFSVAKPQPRAHAAVHSGALVSRSRAAQTSRLGPRTRLA